MTSALVLRRSWTPRSESRRRIHLSAIRVVPPRHHRIEPSSFDDARPLSAVQRSAFVHIFRRSRSAPAARRTRPKAAPRGACVRLLLMERASARHRRLRRLSTSTTASASTFWAKGSASAGFRRNLGTCSTLAFRPGSRRHSCCFGFTSTLRWLLARRTSVRESLHISRRWRSAGTSVLTLAHVFARTYRDDLSSLAPSCDTSRPPIAPRYTRPRTCPVRSFDSTEHTHCARSYSAYCHRESLVSSSPKNPPCSSF
jgi:hypothetical protein